MLQQCLKDPAMGQGPTMSGITEKQEKDTAQVKNKKCI